MTLTCYYFGSIDKLHQSYNKFVQFAMNLIGLGSQYELPVKIICVGDTVIVYKLMIQ